MGRNLRAQLAIENSKITLLSGAEVTHVQLEAFASIPGVAAQVDGDVDSRRVEQFAQAIAGVKEDGAVAASTVVDGVEEQMAAVAARLLVAVTDGAEQQARFLVAASDRF